MLGKEAIQGVSGGRLVQILLAIVVATAVIAGNQQCLLQKLVCSSYCKIRILRFTVVEQLLLELFWPEGWGREVWASWAQRLGRCGG